MTIKELNSELLKAYSINNLNRISLTLITLFRDRQFSVLQKITEIIRDFVNIKISDTGKGFSKLMMLYHPDRAVYHINEINRLTALNNFDGLLMYSHILRMESIEEIAASIDSMEDIDYSPVYEWDFETEGFNIIYDSRPYKPFLIKTSTRKRSYNFFDALKIREYGDTDIELPSYYLTEMEDFELSSSSITDLEGVQFCLHATVMDLSNNGIVDLSPLAGLLNIEELDLSDNRIKDIDTLSNLINLRCLKLMNNFISDISPLLELDKLEYADLSGNKIDRDQLMLLKNRGVYVDY